MSSRALTLICLVETLVVVVLYFLSVLVTNWFGTYRSAYEVFTRIGLWFFLLPLLSAVAGGWLRTQGREDRAFALVAGIAGLGILLLLVLYLVFGRTLGHGGLSG